LRRELIDALGVAGARGMLMRFGFAHGYRTAEVLKDTFPWESEREWRRAGARLHTLQGLVLVDGPPSPPHSPQTPYADGFWRESYEAEQHLLHFGRSEEPVCWTLVGFASGYMSRAQGREILFQEDRCVGKGDATCHVVGKPAEEWKDDVARDIR